MTASTANNYVFDITYFYGFSEGHFLRCFQSFAGMHYRTW
jgi:hypothetical protein